MTSDIITLTITIDFMGMPQTVHPVLLQGESGWLLVDCGYIGSLPLIEQQFESHVIDAAEIIHILITHQDHDHMGAAAAFKAVHPQVKVLPSAGESAYLSGEKKFLRLAQAKEMQKFLPDEQKAFSEAFCRVLRSVEPVSVDETIADGDHLTFVGGCIVIATPGHTPGQISLYLPEKGIILTGDAATLENGRRIIANIPAQSLNCAARAESSVKITTVVVVTSTVLNILLDPVLMCDWGFGLGVTGRP